MPENLSGKNIIITGGTQGIGFGIVESAVKAGANVLTCGRKENPSDQLKQLMTDFPENLTYLKIDVGSVQDCKKLVDYAVQNFKTIDGLVNNAAIFPRMAYEDVTEEHFDTIFNVNAKGAFFVTKYVVGATLKTKNETSIVHIGSINAFAGEPPLAVYSCSKGAVRTLNKHIATNYGNNNIRSNWVTVGWVATETELSRFPTREEAFEELGRLAKKYIPLGRLQTEEDIANTVNFLLSNSSSQITGAEIHVTGGKYF